jgi:signal transduction histidine kinase/ActR/RegA family two-component response regulator
MTAPVMPSRSVFARDERADQSSWTADQQERFRQELLDLFWRQAADVPVPVLLAALTIAALVWSTASRVTIVLWLCAVTALLLLRRWLLWRLATDRNNDAARRLRIAVISSLGSGLVHAAAVWLFFPQLEVLERALMTMIMVGLVAGAVGILAGHIPSYTAYAVPVLLSLAGWWIFDATGTARGVWLEPAIGLLVLLLGLVTGRFAGLSQKLLRRAFAAGLAEEAAREQAELGWREAKLQLQRAEAASQAKTRFLSAASHDLRQPLQAIQWLGDSLVDAGRADRKLIVQRMSEAIESLEGLLKKLLDRSQLDAGVVRPDLSVFDLAALIDQASRDNSSQAAAKSLDLKWRCPGGLRVSSDRTLLLSVFRNLLENAIKYTDQGHVAIEVGLVQEHDVVVRVADTGRGIAPEERARVFEEFYQVGNRQRDASHGFGLGLSIVQDYCALLGIDLRLDSTLGQGTVVELTLPLALQVQDVESGDPPAEVLLPSGLRVLVVEDDERVLDAERRMLERRGCTVATATTVACVKTIGAGQLFDIVVTDYCLPDGTGFDVLAICSASGFAIPAVFVTGDTGVAELRALYESGHEWLSKPVKPATLMQAMQRALAASLSAPVSKEAP